MKAKLDVLIGCSTQTNRKSRGELCVWVCECNNMKDLRLSLLWFIISARCPCLHPRSPPATSTSPSSVELHTHTHDSNLSRPPHHEGDHSAAAGRHLGVLVNRLRVCSAPKLRAPKLQRQHQLVSESESARNTHNVNWCNSSCFPAAAVGAEGAAAAAAAARARAAGGD